MYNCPICGQRWPNALECPDCKPQASGSSPAPGSAIGTATRVVSAILKELRARKGFGWWWEHIDEQTQNELLFTLMEKVEAIISPNYGLGAAGAQMQGCGRDTASQQTLPPNAPAQQRRKQPKT